MRDVSREYLAHSETASGHEDPLLSHLQDVATRAGQTVIAGLGTARAIDES